MHLCAQAEAPYTQGPEARCREPRFVDLAPSGDLQHHLGIVFLFEFLAASVDGDASGPVGSVVVGRTCALQKQESLVLLRC